MRLCSTFMEKFSDRVLSRWRILEILLKTAALLFAGVAAVALAGVVDELILKLLLVVPADRIIKFRLYLSISQIKIPAATQ